MPTPTSDDQGARSRKTPLPISPDLEITPPPFYSKLRRKAEDTQRESDPDGILPPLIGPKDRKTPKV